MEDHQNRRRHHEETDGRQVDIKQRQLDRSFEKEIAVLYRSKGDRQIKLEGNERRPEN